MFGLKNLFTQKSTLIKTLNTQISELLAEYASDTFPLGLKDFIILDKTTADKKNSTLQIVCEIPFAAKGETVHLEQYLSEKMAMAVSVTLECCLKGEDKLQQIKHIILVASGKGGVGKSTTAVNLGAALAKEGAKVGILDADIYGPSIPILLGLEDKKPEAKDDKMLLPMTKAGIKSQSIGFLVPASEATVWRGPMASQALTQLLNETYWGEIDYLVVDMPPGTGDIQLTMSQKVPASGAVIVTTPQDLALADAQKGIAMFEKVNIPILGLVENMSHFICGHCGEASHVFGEGGGKLMAQRYGVPLLGEIPLHLAVREASEKGEMIANNSQDLIGQMYCKTARRLASQIYYQESDQSQVEIVITDD